MGTVTLLKFPQHRKDGRFPICVRVGVNRKYAYETICYVQENHWNEVAKQVRSYDPHHAQYNKLLRERFGQAQELVTVYDERGWPYTALDILAIDYNEWTVSEQQAKQSASKAVPGGLLHYMRTAFIPYWRAKNNAANADKYVLEADTFESFLKSRRIPREDIAMSALTPEFIGAYFQYLRHKPQPCSKDSTLRRRLSQLTAVLNHAYRQGILASLPILDIELDVRKSPKAKLSPQQIEQLENYGFDFESITHKQLLKAERHHQLAIHTFLLQYYLFGARVGDMLLLKNNSVSIQNGEPVRIEYYQQKGKKKMGKKLMSVNVSPRVSAILKHYWRADQPQTYLLPWLDEYYQFDPIRSAGENERALRQALNKATTVNNQALKRMCRRLGIDASISSHSARHSFAMLAKRKGKNIELIREAFNHSSYAITATYLEDLSADDLNWNLADVYD